MNDLVNALTDGNDPLWYKDAIIYELHVRSFKDSDADGVGDFIGLTEKLDYLEDLGVNALWLLPFYPSPLKDDGYDISDYFNIHSIYGTMADFSNFVHEAHRRGLRVITELVINHTSDQHPWFQFARRSPPDSRQRKYYVWSNDPEKYKEARIIFKDYEHSNWSWDHLAKAYYWHRFYFHQPDLNYDNPAIRREIFRAMDFWLRMGIDGMRVDAVPYLYEREGTSCENLPETHAFVKELRKHVDRRFRNRMLLAEANQWPEDAASYFGQGDEFNMAFHFPIMPRLFMAIRMEDRFPIIDIMQQTPPIPETCQWATFLRNHDELTLEMVTAEDRDYMYRMYASDPTARLNLGIRRRLAPLLSNDRRKIELMNILLFSLPGTPVIYYGDEIGMGDNFYLGDRNGVRTPMQWSPERNGGFSEANPQKLYLSPIIDPEYHYEAINVETQEANPESLLWWMKRILSLRKRYKAFGRGLLEFLQPQNRKVLAFTRSFKDETILVIANLSHLPQQTAVDLSKFAGSRIIDVFGRVEFLPVSSQPYIFTLSPYSYFWFSLEAQNIETAGEPLPAAEVPQVLPAAIISSDNLVDKSNWSGLEQVLQNYAKKRRWFRSKARIILTCEISEVIPVYFHRLAAYITFLEFKYTEGESEIYVIPLMLAAQEEANEISQTYPVALIARLIIPGVRTQSVLYDAMYNKSFCSFLAYAINRHRTFKVDSGSITASTTHLFQGLHSFPEEPLEPAPVKAEQTNTSIVYGRHFILKLFRSLEDGINPELEIGRFLTEKTSFRNFSPLLGCLEYRKSKKLTKSLAILQAFIPNEGDAWQYTLDTLENYFQSVVTHRTVQTPPVPLKHLLQLKTPPALAQETSSIYLASAALLGQRTAELHTALASSSDDPAFAPEPFTFTDQTSMYQSMRGLTLRTFQVLEDRSKQLNGELKENVERILGLKDEIIKRFHQIEEQKIRAVRIRCHDDFHLGQVLYTGKDFFIIDFEGEPARSLSERRIKRSPLRDVAGMLRSFHYASVTAQRRQLQISANPEYDGPVLQQWAQYWYTWVSVSFLQSYLTTISQAGLLPEDQGHLRILLDAHLLEKAVYEIGYEINNRPEWLSVPVNGILELLNTG